MYNSSMRNGVSMSNRIKQIFDERHVNVATFARDNGIKATSLYSIIDGKTRFEKVGISTFLKIAHGLGMTAEELYYGTTPEPPAFSDPQQEALNGYYERMNDTGRKLAVDSVKAMSSSPELRMVKEREHHQHQIAMGA